MDRCLMAKITHLCVANLGNSLAITCDLRLDLHTLSHQFTRPRIDQRLLKHLVHHHCTGRRKSAGISSLGTVSGLFADSAFGDSAEPVSLLWSAGALASLNLVSDAF